MASFFFSISKSNVCCYTFESYCTINANNLLSNSNIRFSRYTNIFNILNDDNPLTKIFDGSVTLKDKKKILNSNIESLKNTITWQFTKEEYDVRKPLFE